jgi:hypothetical protein
MTKGDFLALLSKLPDDADILQALYTAEGVILQQDLQGCPIEDIIEVAEIIADVYDFETNDTHLPEDTNPDHSTPFTNPYSYYEHTIGDDYHILDNNCFDKPLEN